MERWRVSRERHNENACIIFLVFYFKNYNLYLLSFISVPSVEEAETNAAPLPTTEDSAATKTMEKSGRGAGKPWVTCDNSCDNLFRTLRYFAINNGYNFYILLLISVHKESDDSDDEKKPRTFQTTPIVHAQPVNYKKALMSASDRRKHTETNFDRRVIVYQL